MPDVNNWNRKLNKVKRFLRNNRRRERNNPNVEENLMSWITDQKNINKKN